MVSNTEVAQYRARYHDEMWKRRRHIEDLVGTFDKWPRAIYRLFFMKLRPTNRERFTLTVFLLCNGVDPEIIKEYYSFAYLFDSQAHRQINYIVNKYPSSRWTAWNVAMGRSM